MVLELDAEVRIFSKVSAVESYGVRSRAQSHYYMPKLDVHMDLLEPSESVTRGPYKGVARYWSARLGDKLVKDIVWSYPAPISECTRIENLLSFYNEPVDVYVDGTLQDRPVTPFS